jgi:hypothetical protein
MSSENELRDVLDEAAKEMARVSSNPRTWQSWLIYLLERLDHQALDENPAHQESFRDMLAALQDAIRNRQRTGGW